MREVKPTQKPVPSSDIKDLFFNSGLLDIWATSLERKYIDRFGNCHLTAAGMEWIFNELVTKFKIKSEQALLAAGYAPAGTFQEGADVVSRNGTVLWKLPDGDGDYYRWDGDLPKQVPAGSTPQSTGGIGKGAWVSVGDASLRGDLKNGDGSAVGLSIGTLNDAINYVTPEMYGAVPWLNDDISATDFVDSYVALQNMFNSGLPVVLTKRYVTSKPLIIKDGVRIQGSGSNRCAIYKSTNNASGLGEFLSPTGAGRVSYDVDAVLIVKKEIQGYVGCLNWSGFRVSKCGSAYKTNNHDYDGVGIFAPYVSEMIWNDVVSFGFKTPFYNINIWNSSLSRVHAHGHEGFIFGGRGGEPDEGGTTLTLNSCWSTATGEGCYPFNFNLIWQAAANAIAAEWVGDGGNPAEGIINANRSYVAITGLDIERAHVKKFINANLSYIDITGVNTYECYAKYANSETYLIDNRYSRVSLRSGSTAFFRDSVDKSVNSNFAKVFGSVATLNIDSFITSVDIGGITTAGYIPEDNDFVIFCDNGGTASIAVTPEVPSSKKQHISNAWHNFMSPSLTANYEEYVDVDRLRSLSYAISFTGRDAVNKGANGDSYILNMTNGNSIASQNNSVQMEFNTQATKVMFRAAMWGGEFSRWREFYTTANTTKDSNGNLKAASPIVKVFADHIESNEESEGVELKKLHTGIYQLKNVLGMHSDASWGGINGGITIPSGINQLPLVYADYDVLVAGERHPFNGELVTADEHGDIVIYTSYRKHFDLPQNVQYARLKTYPEFTKSVNGEQIELENGEPVDIPNGHWIDVRVNMPSNSLYNQKQAVAEAHAKEEAERVAREEAELSSDTVPNL